MGGCRERVAVVREQFLCEQTLAPLVEFCRTAARAADAAAGTTVPLPAPVPVSTSLVVRNLDYARTRFREGGLRWVVERGMAKARRLALKGVRRH